MKSIKKFKTINQVSTILKLPQHVLRFWENKFIQLKPLKLSGNRRYYRDIDVELIIYIKNLLHEDCITIKGVQKIFKNLTINQILKNKNPVLKKKNILVENKDLKEPTTNKINSDNKKILKEILIDLRKIKNSM
ncbi:MAG: MerR family transcriptional regulator [Alphaproteobacteria bacterium]|nr:MerR family transcriptional regulator [Alphaproteobacteria bacterium]